MKSVLWNELRMGTKCVTPIDRLIRINPELVLSSIFSNAKNPAMLWYNLLFIYKNDSDAHVAVCQTAWLLHDLESEFSFFLCLFSIFDIHERMKQWLQAKSVVLTAVLLLLIWNFVCLFQGFILCCCSIYGIWSHFLLPVYSECLNGFWNYIRIMQLCNFTDLWYLIWWSVIKCKVMACCEIVSRCCMCSTLLLLKKKWTQVPIFENSMK